MNSGKKTEQSSATISVNVMIGLGVKFWKMFLSEMIPALVQMLLCCIL